MSDTMKTWKVWAESDGSIDDAEDVEAYEAEDAAELWSMSELLLSREEEMVCCVQGTDDSAPRRFFCEISIDVRARALDSDEEP